MRRAAFYGLVLLCVCVLFALRGPSAQRIVSGDGGGSTSGPVPVSVANFPQVQPVAIDKTVNVTGSVAVTNFPLVQQVAGTVNVGNLPVDAEGAIRVTGTLAAPPPPPHFVTRTTATFPTGGNDLARTFDMSRACDSEFPGTRLCEDVELFRTIPPPTLDGTVWVFTAHSCCSSIGIQLNCYGAEGMTDCTGSPSVACCGY